MQFKKKLLILALASAASMAQASTATTVLTFDGLARDVQSSGLATWNGDQWYWGNYAVSGDTYIHGGRQLEVVFSAPVLFHGSYYNSWGGTESGYTFDLYRNNNHVFRGPADDTSQSNLYWANSSYSGQVDRIVFYGSSDGAVIDNLTYTAAVPEPESYALFLAGLGLLTGVARRRKAGKRRIPGSQPMRA